MFSSTRVWKSLELNRFASGCRAIIYNRLFLGPEVRRPIYAKVWQIGTIAIFIAEFIASLL